MDYSPKYRFRKDDGELIGRFTVYLEKTAQSAQIDYIRKLAYRNKEMLMDKIPEEFMIGYDDPQIRLFTQTDRFNFEEEKLAKAFGELPLLRQKILTLLFVEQLSGIEVADRLNCSVNYVYKLKSLALKKLRDALLEGSDENDG